MSALENADLVATIITVPVALYYASKSWAYVIVPLKKEVLETTGIEIPIPDAPGWSLLKLVLVPVSDMWAEYSATEWSLFGALLHALLALFICSLFKNQAKDALWLLSAAFRYMGTFIVWTWEFLISSMNAPSAPAVAPAPAPAAATKKPARGKSPGPAAAPAPAAAAPAAPAKKARAKSPAPKKTGIKVGKRVKSKHAQHGNKQFEATVVSILGDWCVIEWKDGDVTDNRKHVNDLTLL